MATIKLRIFVPNIANVLTLFDRVRIYRSESGEGGPFFLITGTVAAAAAILGTETAPFTISGKTLSLKVDSGAEQTVTFVTPDDVPVDLAVQEINDQTAGITASEDAGAVLLTSDTTGTSSVVEITGGSALADLGFVLDDIDNGEDAHITLNGGQDEYEYDDQSGDSAYWYQTQYYNSSTEAVSTTSDAVQGDVGTIISAGSLIKAQIDVANPDGTPWADMRITFYNIYSPTLDVGGISMLGRTVTAVTDAVGHAEAYLVQGAELDVTFAGTGITRRITVPSSGAEFDLLGEVSAADDNFQIQTATIPAAVRRS